MRTPLKAVLRLTLAAWVGLAGISIMAAQSRAAVAPESTLPSNTVFFGKVEDMAAFRTAFGKTSFGQMIADPAMKDIKADFMEKLGESSKVLKEKLGVSLDELLTLPEGAVSMALVAKSDPKIPVALAISADAGKNAAKMTEVMTKATKLAAAEAKNDAMVSTETFKGLTLHVIKSGKENTPPLVWTSSGSVFHITSDIDLIKDLISHADGRDDSLAKSENFTKVSKKLGAGGQATWFIDISQIMKVAIKAAAAAGKAGGPNPEQMIQILGVNGLKAAGGNIAFNSGSYDVQTKTFILSPSPVTGVLKLFSTPKASLRPEPWVPATVSTYQTISWDLDAMYTAINDLANTFSPGVLNTFEQQLVGPNGGEPLSFQKDIFGPLGDRITIISDFKKPIKEDSQRMLLAVALEDAKKFQASLTKIIAIAGGTPKTREFQGVTIMDFPIPELPNQPANSPFKGGSTMSLAIAKDYLFLSTEPSLLEQVLRGGGASLSDSPEFQKISKELPTQTSSLSFVKSDDQARVSYDMIKSGAFEKAFTQQPGAPDMSALGKLVNKDKMPDFSVIAKYLDLSGGFGVQDEEGMLFTSFSLRKANP